MADAKHTPGPWREFMGDICASDDEIVICAMNKSCGARSSEFYTYSGKKEVARANARLIAAAPELLEALDGLLEAITAENQHRDRALTITGPTANLKWLLEACDDARAAIAKAEGAA